MELNPRIFQILKIINKFKFLLESQNLERQKLRFTYILSYINDMKYYVYT